MPAKLNKEIFSFVDNFVELCTVLWKKEPNNFYYVK